MPIIYTVNGEVAEGYMKTRIYKTKSVQVPNGTDIEVRTAIANKLLGEGAITAGAHMGIMSYIKHPKTTEFMREISILGNRTKHTRKRRV